eukprot:TRINITY_DN3284_c0_g2_i1.p1 TRINITY_DN3284_c0_g2~~TRINITY_DN3284_c0_g2_i1.p1  ORF type:complete len:380 (-),score=42.38 TRINITY_DN3284_c0_g2_i1:63-1202(-)
MNLTYNLGNAISHSCTASLVNTTAHKKLSIFFRPVMQPKVGRRKHAASSMPPIAQIVSDESDKIKNQDAEAAVEPPRKKPRLAKRKKKIVTPKVAAIELLDEAMMIKIFSYLSCVPDLVSLSKGPIHSGVFAVNKRFNTLSKANDLWQDFNHLEFILSQDPEDFEKLNLARLGFLSSTTKLTLSSQSPKLLAKFDTNILQQGRLAEFYALFPYARQIERSGEYVDLLKYEEMQVISEKCPRLDSFTLGSRYMNDSPTLGWILKYFPPAQIVRIVIRSMWGANNLDSVLLFPALKELVVPNVTGNKIQAVQWFLLHKSRPDIVVRKTKSTKQITLRRLYENDLDYNSTQHSWDNRELGTVLNRLKALGGLPQALQDLFPK